MIRVFSMLGKVDVQLQNPRAYLIRTATNLWIDRSRRSAREQELLELSAQGEDVVARDASLQPELSAAATDLLQRLHPQERAAVVLSDVFDCSLAETASILKTSVGAVKSALHRARGRIDGREAVNEIHRIVESEGVITRVRAYCFCPETLGVVAGQLGRPVVQRRLPHRSPSLPYIPRLLWHHLTTRRA